MTAKSIMVSGGFDPLHPGHVTMIEEASHYGDVIVALNSDGWLVEKKGFVFQPWSDRAAILGALRWVHDVVPVDDLDGTVCQALLHHKPTIFANGGDRTVTNTPELKLCETLAIIPLFGVGGNLKHASSSAIATKKTVPTPWGYYQELYSGDGYKVKLLHIRPSHRTSLQYHHHRSEQMTVLSGRAHITKDDKGLTQVRLLYPGDSITIPVASTHRIANPNAVNPLEIVEVQRGHDLREDDIVRMADDYRRTGR